jgi:hypothetical protein
MSNKAILSIQSLKSFHLLHDCNFLHELLHELYLVYLVYS